LSNGQGFGEQNIREGRPQMTPNKNKRFSKIPVLFLFLYYGLPEYPFKYLKSSESVESTSELSLPRASLYISSVLANE